MDKVELKNGNFIHTFRCDNCNDFLGQSIECDDGYYEDFGRYNVSIFIEGTWYCLHKNLCKNCLPNVTQDLVNTLNEKGFKKTYD